MKHIDSLDQATSAFLAYSPPGMDNNYNLDRMCQLMELLGNPQDQLRTVHIAGTSGKTSTAYFIRGMLEEASYTTGLTVSPHITAINERVQIGGVPLAEQAFLGYVNQFFAIIDQTDIQPTYFELLVGLAYWIFAQEKVDYAVIETGLGGLLDGTNIITRPDKVCVITDIGLDHTEILGETLPEIALQKAGIIHPRNHAIIRRQADEIEQVIVDYAHKQQASTTIVDNEEAPDSLPPFQHRNWAMATATFNYLRLRDNLPSLTQSQLHHVSTQTPPGRWEVYHIGGKTLILDGAHNEQKLQALCQSLEEKSIHSVAAMANFSTAPGSKIAAALRVLQPYATCLIIPTFSAGQDLKNKHSLPLDQLAAQAYTAGFTNVEQQPDINKALDTLLARPEKTLLVTGSFYLVSALRPLVLKLAS